MADRIRIDARRVAVMGCIYGNVPALAACLDDARAAGCDAVLCAGDVLGFCGHAREVLALVERSCAVVIAGNHEREAVAGTGLCGCGLTDPDDEARSCRASAPQADGLEADDLLAIACWPEQAVVETAAGALLLCHGSPDRINEFLNADDSERMRGWLDAAEAQVLACSHTGIPWIRDLGDGRLAVNVGAVGKPDHDGDAAVHYAVTDPAIPAATIRRVVYDHVSWAARLIGEGVDPAIAGQLVTGRWSYGTAATCCRDATGAIP